MSASIWELDSFSSLISSSSCLISSSFSMPAGTGGSETQARGLWGEDRVGGGRVCVCQRHRVGLPRGGSQSAGPKLPQEDGGQRCRAWGLHGRTGGQRRRGEDGGTITPPDGEPGLP